MTGWRRPRSGWGERGRRRVGGGRGRWHRRCCRWRLGDGAAVLRGGALRPAFRLPVRYGSRSELCSRVPWFSPQSKSRASVNKYADTSCRQNSARGFTPARLRSRPRSSCCRGWSSLKLRSRRRPRPVQLPLRCNQCSRWSMSTSAQPHYWPSAPLSRKQEIALARRRQAR